MPTSTITAEQAQRIRAAARAYSVNVGNLIMKDVTPDQHRARNREIRADLTDAEWERAKASALGQMA